MKIVVLAGGISTERDVSIVSGSKVCEALRGKGHDAILVDVYFGKEDISVAEAFSSEYDLDQEIAYIQSCNERLETEMKKEREFFGPNVMELCKCADVVFLALHGENGENGKVQAVFDLFNIKYTGAGHLSSAIAMDKGLTKRVLKGSGVPMPKGVTLEKENHSQDLKDYGMEFPVVVKPCCGGSSVGVCIVQNQKEYQAALEEAFSFEDEVVVEDYISGREFSVGVVAGKAYPVIEIAPVNGFYDYKNKYTKGGAVETCPADLPAEKTEEMQSYAVQGTRELGIDSYVRWDFLMDGEGRLFCLEANTLPGMTPTSLLPQEAQALGIDFPSLCELLIQCSLNR